MATIYRSGQPYGRDQPGWLTPYEVRNRTFPPRRRGVDGAEVAGFLHQLANQLTETQREMHAVLRENERLKRALREWQHVYAPNSPATDPPPVDHPVPARWTVTGDAGEHPPRTR